MALKSAARLKHFKFTDKGLRKLPEPTNAMALYYDTEVPGLCFRITQQGARAFVLRYRSHGRERYTTIGRFSMTPVPEWTVSAARTRASELKERVRLDHDPLDEARADRAAQTVQDMIDRFREEYLPLDDSKGDHLRPSSKRDYRNLIAHDFGALGKIRLKDLTLADIDGWHRKISKRAPIRANMAHTILRKMLNLAIKWGWIDKNPALGVKHNPEEKRQRYLTPDELARLTEALASEVDRQGANIIQMLMFTGARRGEVQSARWDDFDLGQGIWSKPASGTKQKKLHRIPLSTPARQLLTDLRVKAEKSAKEKNEPISEWVFPAVKSECGHRVEITKTWYALRKAAKIKDDVRNPRPAP